jgi:hypothetical protein
MAIVSSGSGFTHTSFKDNLCLCSVFTHRSSKDSLHVGLGFTQKSSNESKLENQKGLLLARLANQEIPEESGGPSNAMCQGQRINLGATANGTVRSYNVASTLNVVIESQDAVSDTNPQYLREDCWSKRLTRCQQ